MTSVIKSDSELTKNPDSIDSNPTEEPRVSIDDTLNEDKPRVSQIELNSIPSPPSDVDSTIVFDGGSVNDVEGRVSESNDESDGDDKNEDLGFVLSSSGGGKEVYSSLLSDFEDFVANEKREASAATSRARSFGFEIGDMVWGKVKSHPWWPGHIFNEVFASSSVRRTRREGHVLVAFFGDSSYGWFDPAELIPFDPHFAEKSQQLNSRTFVKAVEEAVDEASRRCGLGLVCKCRNKYNFRPTNAQGYLAVDVPDYEAGGVYSGSQITKARDDFSPAKVLGFIKDLAQVVQSRGTNSIEFIKNKATVFALRKATFEEFDETYAEAFGTQPTRPSSNAAKASSQPPKAPTRAPLSGPLVIAEALGDRKSSKKSPKLKDNVKKDKYLFKRRDEPSDSKAFQIGQKQDDSFTPAAYMEGSPLVADGDYGLQMRMPAPKHEQTVLISSEAAGPRESEQKQPSPEHPSGNFGASATYVVRGQGILQSVDKQMVLDVGGGPSTGGSDLSSKEDNLFSVDSVLQSSQQEGEVGAAHGLDESTKSFKSNESSLPNEMSISAGSDGERLDNVGDGSPGSHLSVSKNSSVMGTADGVINKAKVIKRPIGELNSENSETGEKKKKKKKVSVVSPDHPVKRTASGKAIMKNSAGKRKQQSLGSAHLDLPELLHDLHDLALDASNSGRQNHRSLARRFFLRFRSLIYQKSLVASPSSGAESVEIRTSKSMSSVGALDDSAGENVVPSKTVVKPLGRPDDPTRGGKKRLPSDRLEEIAAKRLKKINHLKSMAADKKAGQKPLDAQGEVKEPVGAPTPKYTQREAKEPVAASAPKLVKPSAKKMAPTKVVEPTMLVMKFPPQTSLPSGAELKAKFARFGSIDQSAIRVFWKSSTCRVVFRYKSDAQAAYRYAMGNKSLFGNLEVRYMLREVGAGADAPDSDNARGGDTYVEVPRVKDPLLERPTPPLAPIPLPQLSMQPPKSILKKPNGDEASVQGSSSNGRGTSRVKFMLAGEETSASSKAIEQTMSGYRNNNNNNNNSSNNNSTATSIGVGGAATSVASEYNSKNFQKFVPPPSSLPPLLPSPPPQFAKPPHPLNNTNFQNPNAAATSSTHTSTSSSSRQNVDISHEMLSLLTKCNDVVSGVRGLLGYVPYHPL